MASMRSLYLCLHHQHALHPHASNNIKDIDGSFTCQHVQQDVKGHKGPRATHPRRAVDQEGHPFAPVVRPSHLLYQLEHGGGLLGHSVIWPRGEVVVSHCEWSGILVHLLHMGCRKQLSQNSEAASFTA